MNVNDIKPEVFVLAEQVEAQLADKFRQIDKIAAKTRRR